MHSCVALQPSAMQRSRMITQCSKSDCQWVQLRSLQSSSNPSIQPDSVCLLFHTVTDGKQCQCKTCERTQFGKVAYWALPLSLTFLCRCVPTPADPIVQFQISYNLVANAVLQQEAQARCRTVARGTGTADLLLSLDLSLLAHEARNLRRTCLATTLSQCCALRDMF